MKTIDMIYVRNNTSRYEQTKRYMKKSFRERLFPERDILNRSEPPSLLGISLGGGLVGGLFNMYLHPDGFSGLEAFLGGGLVIGLAGAVIYLSVCGIGHCIDYFHARKKVKKDEKYLIRNLGEVDEKEFFSRPKNLDEAINQWVESMCAEKENKGLKQKNRLNDLLEIPEN